MAFIPALRFDWLTPLYDPLLELTLPHARYKAPLVAAADLRPGQRVLDVGCGTGALLELLGDACPDLRLVGLDGDPAILALARARLIARNRSVDLVKGLATAPPFPANSFDRIVSSLVFHHLLPDEKREALGRLFDLLVPGGVLVIADWHTPANLLQWLAFLPVQLLDGFETTVDHVAGRLPGIIGSVGFGDVTVVHRAQTLYGTLATIRAVKPVVAPEAPGL